VGWGDNAQTLEPATNRIVGSRQQHKSPFVIGDKMSVVQRKAMLKSEGFFPHKKNAKGTTIIYSRKHPTARFVRVVIDSGIDSKTNKVVGKVGVKLCFVNRMKSWREITGQVFTTNTGLVKTIKAQEAAEKFVKICKHCKAKKFTAKTGNVVCSNACWTAWAGKKKSEKTTKKSSQPTAQKKSEKTTKKSSRKKTAQKMTQSAAKKSWQRKGQRNLQRFSQEILPGDLVTVEEFMGDKVTTDYTGSVLGIVQKVVPRKRAKRGQPSLQGAAITTVWTANTALVPVWLLPQTNEYEANALKGYRFKVLSRKVEWVEVA
jgi:uncharacterized Zn finger protein (UPF0148 family)